jgi:N-formylglutamate amidohydrolase
MIIHIPHASPHIPPGERSKITLQNEKLAQELLKITDWFTDELTCCHTAGEDAVVIFPVSRLVVDPERFLEDAHEPMAKVGRGVVYTKTSGGLTLRAQPTVAERDLLLGIYYLPHHKRLSDAVDAELERHGFAGGQVTL